MHLNEKQALAVQSIQRSSLIISPAGTGKTFCVAEKIAFIQQQYGFPGILALSFTKRATAEIESRIRDKTNVTVCNLCQFFLRLLRRHGFGSYQIITEDKDRMTLASLAIARAGLTKTVDETILLDAMDTCKLTGNIKKAAQEYLRLLKETRQFDFNAVSYFAREILRNNLAICRKYQAIFKFVIVDEAQDLNAVQYSILRLLFPGNRTNVTFVGDPRQQIMTWRGAVTDILTRFQSDYGADVYELALNYRSVPEIINLANELQSEYAPMVATKSSIVLPPVFYTAPDADSEGDYIVQEIRKLIANGNRPKDIAVLYRSMPVAVTVFEKLLDSGLPVVKTGASFFRWSSRPFRELRLLLNLLRNPTVQDFQYCSSLFGIDATVIRNIARYPEFKEASLTDLLSYLMQDNYCNLEYTQKLERLRHLTELLDSDIKVRPLREIVCRIWDFILRPYFEAEDDGILDSYLSATRTFKGLDEMLAHVKKMEKQMVAMAKLAAKPDKNYIIVESIHSAKGLAYSAVFVCGCSDGVLPDTSHLEETNIPEERCIAYTAVTRGCDRLYISYAARSDKAKEPAKPSRFFAKYFNGYTAPRVMSDAKVAETNNPVCR